MQKLIFTLIASLGLISISFAGPRESTALVEAKGCNGGVCSIYQGTAVAVEEDEDYTYLVTAKHVIAGRTNIDVVHLGGRIKAELVTSKGDLAILRVKGHTISTVCIVDPSEKEPILNISHDEASYKQSKRSGTLIGDTCSFPSKQGASGSGVFNRSGDLVGMIVTADNSHSYIITSSAMNTCFKRRQRPKPNQTPATVPPPADVDPPANAEVPPPQEPGLNNLLERIINDLDELKGRQGPKDLEPLLKELGVRINGLGPKIEGQGELIKSQGTGVLAAIKDHKPDLTGVGAKVDGLTNLATWGLSLAALIGIPGLGAIPFVLKGLSGVKTAVKGIGVVHHVLHPPVAPVHGTQVIIPGAAVPGDFKTVDSVVIQPKSIDTGFQAFQAMKDAWIKKNPNADIHTVDALFNQFYSGLSPKL